MPARAPMAPQPVAMSGAAHTSGIYSDMTVDGIEIGTLVVVVDRARHLPNLRTMGKQDPYCAARLGKEAKKTDTDRRGGQTPRWDQELRFTVRDGADYNRLKVSVFNDDKKTDLIGETWVMLDSLLLPGGGQGDSWHTLTCKGRYAGEIRVELTYYDTRPKENRARQPRQKTSSVEATKRTSHTTGPRDLPTLKRRPLPAPGGQEQQAQAAPEPFTSDAIPTPQVQARSHPTHAQRLSSQVYDEPEEEEAVELEPDIYTQHPSALASYASTATNPYYTSNSSQDTNNYPHNSHDIHQAPNYQDFDQQDAQDYYHAAPENEIGPHEMYAYQPATTSDAAHHFDPEAHPNFSSWEIHRTSAQDDRRHTAHELHLHGKDASPQYLANPYQQYSDEHSQYEPDVPSQRRFSHSSQQAPLRNDGVRTLSNNVPRPLPPVMLPHSSSAPETVHRGGMQDEFYGSDQQMALTQVDHPVAYSSPAYEPHFTTHATQQVPVTQHPTPHRSSMPAFSVPTPMHLQQVQSDRPLPVHASSAPENLPLAHDVGPQPLGNHPRSLPQPVHHATYPGFQQTREQYGQQQSAGYATQQHHSIPDFSRTYDASVASVAPLRSGYGQQPQLRSRPISMLEPATSPLYSPQPGEPPANASSTPQHLARKSISSNSTQASPGYHFSPDSFDTYNTHSSRPSAITAPDTSPREAREPSPMYAISMPSAEVSSESPDPDARVTSDGRILTKSGKVVDPSDHIPSTSWAPEPEPKAGKRPTVAVHIKNRFGPREARTLPMPAAGTGSNLASVSSSPLAGASMRPRHSIPAGPAVPLPLPQSNSHPGRSRLQQRIPSNPLAESAPGTINSSYRAPSNPQAPPIPPKLPLGYANGEFTPANEPINDALTQEMSLIDIGPSENRGRRRGLFGRNKKRDENFY